MQKQKRQFAIREILEAQHISSHEELALALRQAGFPTTTQTTVSRDLAEMGIGRLVTPKGPRYMIDSHTDDTRIRALMSYEVTSIQQNESMIVIKTLAGRAQGVAELIDSMHSPHILGTIAGDNTIFIAPKSIREIARLVCELRAFITSE